MLGTMKGKENRLLILNMAHTGDKIENNKKGSMLRGIYSILYIVTYSYIIVYEAILLIR